jgi:predicted AAA+ superfamily ATPase
MFHRQLITKLNRLAIQFPVLAIIGPRQIGKSTLAKMFAEIAGKNYVLFDLEKPSDQLALEEQTTQVLESNKENLVIIDEVQRQKALFPIMRYMVDEHRIPLRFLLLGSASPELIVNSSESLAGRIAFAELCGFLPVEVGVENWRKLWFRGGYPSAYLQDNNLQRKDWFENYINTYVQRDLPLLGMPSEPGVTIRLLYMLAHLNGQVLNMSNLSRSIGFSVNTIKTYLYFLENAGLIRLLQPWFVNSAKRVVKNPKMYFRDTGILHFLMGIQKEEDLLKHPACGASFESFIIEKTLSHTDLYAQGYFYSEHSGGEIDLLLVEGIQVKTTIEIKLGGLNNLNKVSKVLHQSFRDAQRILVSGETNKNLQLTSNMEMISIENYFSDFLVNLAAKL